MVSCPAGVYCFSDGSKAITGVCCYWWLRLLSTYLLRWCSTRFLGAAEHEEGLPLSFLPFPLYLLFFFFLKPSPSPCSSRVLSQPSFCICSVSQWLKGTDLCYGQCHIFIHCTWQESYIILLVSEGMSAHSNQVVADLLQ